MPCAWLYREVGVTDSRPTPATATAAASRGHLWMREQTGICRDEHLDTPDASSSADQNSFFKCLGRLVDVLERVEHVPFAWMRSKHSTVLVARYSIATGSESGLRAGFRNLTGRSLKTAVAHARCKLVRHRVWATVEELLEAASADAAELCRRAALLTFLIRSAPLYKADCVHGLLAPVIRAEEANEVLHGL